MSSSCYPCLAEQAGYAALRLSKTEKACSGALEQAFFHQCFPAHTPALPGEGWSGEYPSPTHRCPSSLLSCCLLAQLAGATLMAGGQGTSPQRGTTATQVKPRDRQGLSMLTARHVPWSWAPALQDWAFLWINQKCDIFCLALNVKAEVIWKLAVLTYFYFYWCSGFNFCKLLRSFAKPVAELQLSLA